MLKQENMKFQKFAYKKRLQCKLQPLDDYKT